MVTKIKFGLTAVIPGPPNSYKNFSPYVEMEVELNSTEDYTLQKDALRAKVWETFREEYKKCKEIVEK